MVLATTGKVAAVGTVGEDPTMDEGEELRAVDCKSVEADAVYTR
jgi:hypothetical protein